MNKFIVLKHQSSPFDNEGDVWAQVIEITEGHELLGTVWVNSVPLDKALIIAKALNDSSNDPKG